MLPNRVALLAGTAAALTQLSEVLSPRSNCTVFCSMQRIQLDDRLHRIQSVSLKPALTRGTTVMSQVMHQGPRQAQGREKVKFCPSLSPRRRVQGSGRGKPGSASSDGEALTHPIQLLLLQEGRRQRQCSVPDSWRQDAEGWCRRLRGCISALHLPLPCCFHKPASRCGPTATIGASQAFRPCSAFLLVPGIQVTSLVF